MTDAPISYARPPNTAPIALRYLDKHPGRYLFPLAAGKKGRPCIKDNLDSASNDAQQIKTWARMFPGCIWGCATKKSGIVCVDIDCGPGKEGEQSMRTLVAAGNALPMTETQRSPSGGYHKIYSGAHHFSASKIGMHIDTPNYFVIEGCSRGDGKSYTLSKDIEAAPLPDWIAEKIKPRAERPRSNSVGVPVPLDTFKKMLAATPYTGGPAGLDDRHEYEGWLAFAMACHEAAGGDEADYLAEFIEWCLNDPHAKETWTGESIERHWQSFTADPPDDQAAVTRASWFKILDGTGHGDLVGEATASGEFVGEDFSEPVQPANDNLLPTPEPPDYGRPLTAKELRTTEFPKEEFVIQDLILKGWGQPIDGDAGVGKSLLGAQSAVHVASGSEIFKLKVKQQPVLYITHEDNYGPTKDRMLATARSLELSDSEFDELPLLTKSILDKDITLAIIDDNGGIKDGPFRPALESWLKDFRGAFVVLDCASDVVQMNDALRPPPNAFFKNVLKPLCMEYDATIQVLRHPSKQSMRDETYYAGGTANRTAIRYGLVFRLADKSNQYGARILEPNKRQYWGAIKPLVLEVHPEHGIFVRADSDPTILENRANARNRVLDHIGALIANGTIVQQNNKGNGTGPRDIAKTLSMKGVEVHDIITAAISDGTLVNHVRAGRDGVAHITFRQPGEDFEPPEGDESDFGPA